VQLPPHVLATVRRNGDVSRWRGAVREEMMLVRLMQILLSQKMKKKITRSIQLLQMDSEDLKQ
jgi:hypothetical protein